MLPRAVYLFPHAPAVGSHYCCCCRQRCVNATSWNCSPLRFCLDYISRYAKLQNLKTFFHVLVQRQREDVYCAQLLGLNRKSAADVRQGTCFRRFT